jgi:hypothetical protein
MSGPADDCTCTELGPDRHSSTSLMRRFLEKSSSSSQDAIVLSLADVVFINSPTIAGVRE